MTAQLLDGNAFLESVKRDLASRTWESMQDYADAKSDVIAEIMARAELWSSQADD